MQSLKDFVKSARNSLISSSDSSPTINLAGAISKRASVLSLALTSNEVTKFSDQINELVNGDEVLTELSETIGLPRETETESEFIERASSALKDILRKKLKT